jgi:hypothetical protein
MNVYFNLSRSFFDGNLNVDDVFHVIDDRIVTVDGSCNVNDVVYIKFSYVVIRYMFGIVIGNSVLTSRVDDVIQTCLNKAFNVSNLMWPITDVPPCNNATIGSFRPDSIMNCDNTTNVEILLSVKPYGLQVNSLSYDCGTTYVPFAGCGFVSYEPFGVIQLSYTSNNRITNRIMSYDPMVNNVLELDLDLWHFILTMRYIVRRARNSVDGFPVIVPLISNRGITCINGRIDMNHILTNAEVGGVYSPHTRFSDYLGTSDDIDVFSKAVYEKYVIGNHVLKPMSYLGDSDIRAFSSMSDSAYYSMVKASRKKKMIDAMERNEAYDDSEQKPVYMLDGSMDNSDDKTSDDTMSLNDVTCSVVPSIIVDNVNDNGVVTINDGNTLINDQVSIQPVNPKVIQSISSIMHSRSKKITSEKESYAKMEAGLKAAFSYIDYMKGRHWDEVSSDSESDIERR